MTEYEKLVAPYQSELLDTLKQFVRINSVNYGEHISEEHPFGPGVSKALDFICNQARKDGFTAVNYKNMVVEITCGSGTKNLTILAHADVVPEGKGWPYDPFTVREEDGVLYGRGVADDKGPLLAAYYALKALKDNNMLGDYLVRFIVGGNEESGSEGVKYYFEELKKEQPTFGFSPDSSWPLNYSEKGIIGFKVHADLELDNIVLIRGGLASNAVCDECIVVLQYMDRKLVNLFKETLGDKVNVLPQPNGVVNVIVKGVAAHGSMPSEGVNAAMLALKVLKEYYHNERLDQIVECYEDVYGRGIDGYYEGEIMEGTNTSMNLGVIDYRNGHMVLTINYRYPDTFNFETAWPKIEAKNAPMKLEIEDVSPLLCYKKDCDLIRILMDSYQKESGDYVTEPIACGGGTYAKEAENTVAFGAEFPGWDSKMHGVNERIKKEDLYKSMAIYARAIVELGKKLSEK